MKGIQLKTILLQSGKTQSEIAELIGETKQNFNSFLRSDDLRSSLIERVAAALNVSVSSLYGEHQGSSASATNGGTSIAGSNNQLNTQIDKFLDLLREKDVQAARFQKEIDRLIGLLEKK